MRNKINVLIVAIAGHFLDHFFILSFSVLIPVFKEIFSVNYTQIGLTGNIIYFVFGLGAPISGFLIDKIGALKVIKIYALGSTVALFMIVLSASFHLVIAGFVILGIFASLFHPAGYSFITLNIEEPGTALGIMGVFGTLSVALTPVVVSSLAQFFGWRKAILALGIVAAIYSIMLIKFGKEGEFSGRRSESGGYTEKGYLLVPLIFILTFGALNGFTYRGFVTYLPSFFTEKAGGMLAKGGLYSTLVLLSGIVGQIIGGKLAESAKREIYYVAVTFFSLPFLIATYLVSGNIVLFTTIGFSLMYFGFQPLSNRLIAAYTTSRFRGRFYGLTFFLNFGIGSLAVSIGGYMADRFGIHSVFLLISVSLFLAFLIGLGLLGYLRVHGKESFSNG